MSHNAKRLKDLLKMILVLLPITAAPILSYSQTDSLNLYDLSVEQLLNLEVVSASQKSQKATEAPATIYVVTEQQIAERGYTSLDELLEDIPEIEIQKKSNAEYSNHYSIRGIGGNEKFLILMDGLRVNAPDGTPHVVGVNYSLNNIKQVEVILGPASALYGVDGFSGIINLISKNGDDINGVKVSGKFGSFRTHDHSVTLGYGKKNDFSFHANGHYYHSDEPMLPDYYKNKFQWYNNEYSKNGNVILSPFNPIVIPTSSSKPFEMPTNAHSFNLGFTLRNFDLGFYQNSEAHSSSQSLAPEFSIYEKSATYKVTQQTVYANYFHEFANEKLSLRNTITLSSFEIDPSSKFNNTFSGYQNAYKYGLTKSMILREQLTYELSEKTSLIGGLNLQSTNALAKSSDLPVPFRKNVPADLQNLYYLGTNTTDSTGRDLTIYQDFYYIQENNVGLFTQYQQNFSDLVNLTIGVRYDYNSRFGSTINPRAGLVITPSEALKFKVLYGEAYLAPSIYKSYQHYGGLLPVDKIGAPTSDPDATAGLHAFFMHLPNTNLSPEKLRTAELGASFVKKNLGLAIDVYYNNITNLITSDVQFGQTFKNVPVEAAQFPVNAGTASTYGFTAKVDYHEKIGDAKIQSYVAYSFADGDIDGRPLSYTAKSTIKAGVLFKYRKFNINPRVIYRSSSNHGFLLDDNDKPLQNDAFAVVNMFVRYQLRNNLEFNLKVKNLFDARYYNVSYGEAETFPATPQDPRTFIGGFILKL
jgi:outer membrane receptor for ferrienterochelin and colicin